MESVAHREELKTLLENQKDLNQLEDNGELFTINLCTHEYTKCQFVFFQYQCPSSVSNSIGIYYNLIGWCSGKHINLYGLFYSHFFNSESEVC